MDEDTSRMAGSHELEKLRGITMEDYVQRNTSMMKGDWTEGIKSLADTIDGILTMKNDLAEKKQKRDMNEIQMQQMRMQLQGQQRTMQREDALQKEIESISQVKRVPKAPTEFPEEVQGFDPEELKSTYTPEKLNELLTKEVPLSQDDYLQRVVDVQLKHKIAQDPKLAFALLKERREAQNPLKASGLSDNQLYALTLSPNPEVANNANAILKRKQTEKVELETIKKDIEMRGLDLPDLAQALKNGEATLSQIKNTRGNALSNKVMIEVRKELPRYNFMYQEANFNYLKSATNARIIGAVDASLPRVNMLAAQAESLKNADLPAINAVMKQILTQTGSPVYTNFESNRNAIVQEVNTALSGSAQGSDMRVQIELENLKSSRSPAQLLGAISNLREALIARKDASMQYIYPMEVVRGEITQQQWKKEMDTKYRGKYGSGEEEQPKKKKSPVPKSAWVGRNMGANPGMTKAQVEAEYDKRFLPEK